MPFTFQGKDILNLFQTGNTYVVIPGILSTSEKPELFTTTSMTAAGEAARARKHYPYHQNYRTGIKIGGADINDLAISKYVDFNNTKTTYINNVGYKHISIIGSSAKGSKGANSGACNSFGGNRGGAEGGDGGSPIKFGINKIPLNNENVYIDFVKPTADDAGTHYITIKTNTRELLKANNGAKGNNANSPGREPYGGGGKYCANSAHNGDTGAQGTITPLSGFTSRPVSELNENTVRFYLHYDGGII